MNVPPLPYRPDIDGLRAVAVLAVVFHHLWPSLVPGGYVGVDVFFVISGYLITSILLREIAGCRFSLRHFYERRVRRILPALLAVLVASMSAGYFILLPSDYAHALKAALGTLFFSSNVLFWRDTEGYFNATDARLNPLLHTWSLAVEEQFYILFPLFLLLCHRKLRRHLFGVLLGCALMSLLAAAVLVHTRQAAVFFLSPFRAWELLAGSLLAVGGIPAVRTAMAREALALAGVAAIAAACFMLERTSSFPGLNALAPVLGAAAIIHAGSSGATVTGRLLRCRPAVYIGLISYSLYLWHWPVLVFTQYANGMEPLGAWLPAVFAVSLLLGALSFHFIERPFRHPTPGWPRQRVFSSAALAAVLLAVPAAAGLLSGGVPGRFDDRLVQLDRFRSPDIPYRECESRAPGDWCVLGKPGRAPTVLLWGDSHMLAWAPALHRSLTATGDSAVLAATHACPPLLGVANAINARCEANNLGVKAHLLAHPEIGTVVASAFWSTYFREGGPLRTNAAAAGMITQEAGLPAAQQALAGTAEWLHATGRRLVLIGPVPVPGRSVPLALALTQLTGRGALHTSMGEQHTLHAPFLGVAHALQAKTGLRLVDPIRWLCTDECRMAQGGIPIYRDEHHLSVDGALALQTHLGAALRQPWSDEPYKIMRVKAGGDTK